MKEKPDPTKWPGHNYPYHTHKAIFTIFETHQQRMNRFEAWLAAQRKGLLCLYVVVMVLLIVNLAILAIMAATYK